jgi:hypothetical protein
VENHGGSPITHSVVAGVVGKEVEKEGATMVLKCSLKNEKNFIKVKNFIKWAVLPQLKKKLIPLLLKKNARKNY